MDEKIAVEVAEAEFERLCELRRIDIDTTDMTEKEADDFQKLRKLVVKALRARTLLVLEDGQASYTPPVQGSKALVFRMPKGATFMALDSAKSKGDQAKMAALIVDMTGCSPGDPSALDAPDYVFCSKLVGFFLAAG